MAPSKSRISGQNARLTENPRKITIAAHIAVVKELRLDGMARSSYYQSVTTHYDSTHDPRGGTRKPL